MPIEQGVYDCSLRTFFNAQMTGEKGFGRRELILQIDDVPFNVRLQLKSNFNRLRFRMKTAIIYLPEINFTSWMQSDKD